MASPIISPTTSAGKPVLMFAPASIRTASRPVQTGRTAYACDHYDNHIYPLAGTIFEKTTTSLKLWFHAMFQMGSTKCGISAKQIQRETGVTYKTAWRRFKQIRSLMSEEISLEASTVEMDETYHGGKRKDSVSGQEFTLSRWDITTKVYIILVIGSCASASLAQAHRGLT